MERSQQQVLKESFDEKLHSNSEALIWFLHSVHRLP